jgi:CubicO group peptidase (beta-lactamase class C family)
VFAPGTTPAYSNYCAALTGEAVATLEGAPYQSVVEREITGPLGMSHTTFREPYPRRADLPAPMTAALAADRAGL